ncbi:MAG: polysaccharide deacetylase family protein [Clostridium sp.]
MKMNLVEKHRMTNLYQRMKSCKSIRSGVAGCLTASILILSLCFLFPLSAYAGNWKYDGIDWKFYNNDGTFRASEWFQDEDGCWYYLDSEGKMMIDMVTPDGYTVGKDGSWIQKIPQVKRYVHIIPDDTCNHRAGKIGEPIFQVATDQPLVALSFDSGSDTGYTDQILEILDKYDIRSTFFVTKDWMNAHETDVKKIHDHGHEIGNHTVNHPDMTKLSARQMSAQIQDTHLKIKELTGQDAFLLRAPFGAYNTAVVDTIKNNGYYSIQWTVDSLDWKNLGVQPILDRVLKSDRLQNGAIVLMHNGADYTPQALETIIKGILERGYQIIPVSELIYTRDYQIDGNGVQHSTKTAA